MASGTNGARAADVAVAGVRDFLREFYGRTVQRTTDLTTGACCPVDGRGRFHDILRQIPEEVKQRQFGCGSPVPEDDLAGLTVVDLGCGAGTDCFILAKLVGPAGKVVGLDMTEEQLAVARRNAPSVMQRYGYEVPNVDFRRDFIETAETVPSGSADLIVSNCVINLSPLKVEVFRSIRRILRPGGEFFVSDIVCDRRLPDSAQREDRIYGECLSGSEYYGDLRDIMEEADFRDVREVSRRTLRDRVGLEGARFCSVTLRGFKIDKLDRRCEDYGQVATYRGNCSAQPVEFRLDAAHVFERGRPVAVCRNTARMLGATRLAAYFQLSPEVKHFGAFPCGTAEAAGEPTAAGCC